MQQHERNVNHMLVNQIADALNYGFYPEATGTLDNADIDSGADTGVELFKDDLSNVVELGRKLTASSEYGTYLNQALQRIIDKVGQTIYQDGDITSGGFDIYATDAEYGSILEKIRVEAPDFEENEAWNFTEDGGSTHEDMFGYHAVDAAATYFNATNTFRTKPYTISEKQFASAFQSRSEMLRFIGRIEQRVVAKRRLAINLMSHKAVTALIAEKLKDGNNVIDLLAEYVAETGDSSVTTTNWKTSEDFLLFANTYVRTISDIMIEPTALYNNAGYVSQAKESDRRFYLLSDFARAIESYVYRSSYNEEYVKLTGYKTIAYWQGVGQNRNTSNYLTRSTVNAIPPSEGKAPAAGTPDTRQVIRQSNIVGVIFSKLATVVNAKKLESGVVYNPMDHWYNTTHQFDGGYFVDPDENAVIFVIGTKPAIKITNETLSVVAGGTLQMTAATLPPDATITWSTDATTYGTINATSGLLTTTGAGTIKVTASITGSEGTTVTDSVDVTVTVSKKATKTE